jgi:hypothetical protein
MAEGDDGFLSRWSKRKRAVREGEKVEAEPVNPAVPQPEAPALAMPPPQPSPGGGGSEQPQPPTLEDVQALTADSDFRRFLAPDVAPEVKNAAMKKLFADPHFNTMDGLDVYIDDYGKPDPMPASMLKQLVSAKFLKLFDDEEKKEAAEGAREAAPEASAPNDPAAAPPAPTPGPPEEGPGTAH